MTPSLTSNCPFHPAWVEIDLDAIAHNYQAMRRLIGPDTMIYPVVKSDAYGHGLVPVSRRLVSEGANGLCVARMWEARELRGAGVTAPILVLASVFPEESQEAVAAEIDVAVFRREPAEALSAAARAIGKPARVHLKVDSGMGRLGIEPADAVAFAQFLKRLDGIETVGLMSHFSSSDDEEDTVTREQLEIYRGVAEALTNKGLLPRVCHIANSAGAMRFEAARNHLTRPGMATYGCHPSGWTERNVDLRPAMSVRARLISVRQIPAGRPLSYSRQFVTKRDSIIGVAPVGYADGYMRALMHKTAMIVRGKRAPVLGRICMEQSLLDLTDHEKVDYGDIVTVMGEDGAERVTADDLARWAGTINYEIVSRLGRQFPHLYHKNGKWSGNT